MLYAVIDVGSNAARLLLANATGELGNIKVEKDELIRVPLRLGKDVFSNGKILKERQKLFLKTMKAFKLLQEIYSPDGFRACATAAMREASNKKSIRNTILKRTGINLEIISGEEEASIIRNTNRIIFKNPERLTVFIDVGGGSTEISVEKDTKLISLESFNIGTIRLLSGNYDKNIWDKIFNWLNQFSNDFDNLNVVGSGGNINKINKEFGDFQNIFLSLENIKRAYETLLPLSVEERMEQFNMRSDRADVIIPAAEIYIKIMDLLKAKHIAVPKIGLADGIIHQLYTQHLMSLKNNK